jgi:predicted nucleic acid-binding protein
LQGIIMIAEPQAYMLDTNVFNDVLDEKLSLASFAGVRLLVTGVQADELRNTKNVKRREELCATFEEIEPETVPAESFCFNIEGAGWDQANWNDGSGTFEKMLHHLRCLDDKKKKPCNQIRDIVIGETAIKTHATVVTGDGNLRKVIAEFGGRAIDLAEFAQETRQIRKAVAIRLQEIEGNPLTPDDIAMFEMFELDGWSPERRRAYLIARAKPLAAE